MRIGLFLLLIKEPIYSLLLNPFLQFLQAPSFQTRIILQMKFTTKLSTNGPPNLLSLHGHPQIYITIITFLYLAILILCVNPEFEACAPQSCGDGPIIKYPFWIPHKQPSFCGHPHFEIICNHKKPILRISNHDFVVQSISNSNSSIVVANKAVYEEKCPTPLYDYSFFKTPFISSFENSNMSFFYNCTKEPIDYPTYEVDCVKQSTLHSFAVFHKEALNHQYYFHECQFMTDVPVYVHGISNFTSLLRMNYTEILKMGFIMKWTIPEPDDCQLCEKSGGRCGFDNHKFLCFCKDKIHSKSCGDGNALENRMSYFPNG